MEENYFVYASVSDNGMAEDLDEDEEVILNPILKNNLDLKVEEVSNGLDFPTSMAFLGPDDIVVLEKNEGTVKRIVNGVILQEPLLRANVATESERGMLGIAVDLTSKEDDKIYVFLYYTESEEGDPSEPIGNRLYKYELENNELINPKLLLDLPAIFPRDTHNGGKIVIGPADNNLYLTVGDVGSHDLTNPHTIINNKDGPEPDGRAGILRVTQDGKAVEGIEGYDDDSGILGVEYPLNVYYAYGIRNSFGIGSIFLKPVMSQSQVQYYLSLAKQPY